MRSMIIKSKPQVSICIPTFNRLPYLKKCVQSIISQPEFQDGRVEIAISDNVSTDGTEKWCCEQVEKYRAHGNFIYQRNDHNTGFVNGILAVCRGTGKLRKLSEDTIIYQPGSMKFFCDAVEKYDDEKPLLLFSNQVLPSSKGELGFYDLIYHVGIYTTWFAAFSVWDTDIPEIYDNKDKLDEMIPSTEIICNIMKQKNKGIVLGEEFGTVQVVEKKNASYGLFETFHDRQLNILSKYLPESDEKKKLLAYMEKYILCRHLVDLVLVHVIAKHRFVWGGDFDLEAQIEQQYRDKAYYPSYLEAITDAKRKYTQTCEYVKKIVADKCGEDTDIIIYGAGTAGDILFQVFLDTEIKPTAYCVSDGEHKKSEMYNQLPVMTLSDCEKTDKKKQYFVAAYRPLSGILASNLEKKGIHNYIDITDRIDFCAYFEKVHEMR